MKNKKNLILHLLSIMILCVGYVSTRYVFFDLHGMQGWPLVLFIYGLIIICISLIFKGRQTPIFTALAYSAGFATGVIFQTTGLDAGGGRTNNLWMIWTVVFVCFSLASILTDLFAIRKIQ